MGTLTKEFKEKIDSLDHEELLRLWRFTPIGDDMFVGESGIYIDKAFKESYLKLRNEERVALSKKVGWD